MKPIPGLHLRPDARTTTAAPGSIPLNLALQLSLIHI